MSHKHPAETRERVRALYGRLGNMAETAAQMGLPRSTCFCIVHAGEAKPAPPQHDDPRAALIRRMAKSGMSDASIGEALGIGRYGSKWLRTKFGIPCASSYKPRKADLPRLTDVYDPYPKLERFNDQFVERLAGRTFESYIMKGQRP